MRYLILIGLVIAISAVDQNGDTDILISAIGVSIAWIGVCFENTTIEE